MINIQYYINKLSSKFSDLKIIEIYKANSRQYFVKFECHKHGVFERNLHDFEKSKCGCVKCSREKLAYENWSIKDTEHFIKASKIKHGDKYDYSKSCYSGPDNKVEIICREHGSFFQLPMIHINGSGCPVCGVISAADKQRVSTDYIKEKCYKKYGDKYDYSKTKWIDSNHKIKIICRKHGIFEINYFDFIRGHECPECLKEISKNKRAENFKNKLLLINNNYRFGNDFKYINIYTPVIVEINGEKIKALPSSFLKNEVSSKEEKIISIENRGINKSANRWNNIEYELNTLFEGKLSFKKEQIDFIKSGKSNRETELDVYCDKHGWSKRTFFQVREGYGCPHCFYKKISKGEKELLDYIKSIYKGAVIENDRTILNGKELDIYLPDLKTAFEYDGIYWHNNINNYYKYEECKKQGIRLIQITEWEWLKENEKILSYLRNLFGISYYKIGARKSYVKEIDAATYKNFCNENHIQGYSPASVKLGLFYNDELVEIESFSKPRFSKDYEWELVREVSKIDYQIIGGKSKLLKYFERNYKPKSIISYCEKNKFTGISYLNCGFSLIKESSSGYNYYDKNMNKYSRLIFQKSKLGNILNSFDEKLTETENMMNNGYKKIFDYGNFVFIKKY